MEYNYTPLLYYRRMQGAPLAHAKLLN
jgi:hypothetical protein